MTNVINERTTISLFPVVVMLPVLVSLTFSVAVVYSKTEATESRVNRHADAIKEVRSDYKDIKASLSKIEGILEEMRRSK